MPQPSVTEVIEALSLEMHPEGGWYRRTYTSDAGFKSPTGGDRALASAIYFLVPGPAITLWHRLDADEIWHCLIGPSIVLETCDQIGGSISQQVLGSDLMAGEEPQRLIKKNVWQRCRLLDQSEENWTLVGCTVVPEFSFDGLEMLPPPPSAP